MPKPAEIVAALGDVSAIDSYATLQAEMVDLFTSLADGMKDWSDERPVQIHRAGGSRGRGFAFALG